MPSGATLHVAAAPFAEAKALYQAVLSEIKMVSLAADGQLQNLIKDVFCLGFSSKLIDACLWPCLQICTYDSGAGGLKVDKDTFEPVKNRQDYIHVCMEVAKENIGPFANSLYVEFKRGMQMTVVSQA